MGKADELLNGAIDMHCHVYPEFSLEASNRYSDIEIAQLAINAGMRAYVLKSHFWPTMSHALNLDKLFSEIRVLGSVTLNTCVGGVHPWVVEAAIKLGAKVIWMPTWSAQNDIKRNGISHLIGKYLPLIDRQKHDIEITVLDSKGELTSQAKDVLILTKEYDLPLFSGHLSPIETFALAKMAKQIKFRKFVFGHPDSKSIGASEEDIRKIAECGCIIEICALGLMPILQRISPFQICKIIKSVGVNSCILSTDYFFDSSPAAPEMLRMLVSSLLEVGMTSDDISIMIKDNPARLLNLE